MTKKILLFPLKHKKWICAFIILAGIAIYYVMRSPPPEENTKTPEWTKVSIEPAVLSVHKYGKISTAQNVSITAPFDGSITKVSYSLGDKIIKGQQLITLSTDKILKKMHDAKSDYLKKKEDYEKYVNWNDSSDVQKAKQSLMNSKRQLKIAKEKLKNDKFLFKRGIISKDTLDQQEQSVIESSQQLESSEMSLSDTLKQGSKSNTLIARLAMLDAKNSLDTILHQIQHATIVAPATGIALKPKDSGEKTSSSFEAVVGESVSENQNMLTIGDSNTLEVISSLSQEEINQIKKGMSVSVTCDAFPKMVLNGKVHSISRLADEGASSPVFPFTVDLPSVPTEEKKLLRIGLLVDMNLEIYRKDNAMVIPVSSVYRENNKAYVWVKNGDGKKNKPIKRYVDLGPTLPNGVVVNSGLTQKDEVKTVPS